MLDALNATALKKILIYYTAFHKVLELFLKKEILCKLKAVNGAPAIF